MSRYSDNTCVITIDNNDYYIPCDRVGDLDFIDGYLVNVSTSNLTLKDSYSDGTTYPYISCGSQSACVLRTRQNYDYEYVRSDYVFKDDWFKVLDYTPLIFLILFIILGVKLVWKK